MAEMTGYAHGVPSWVDLATPDLEASLRFYLGFFGWDAQDLGEEAGHYTIVSKEGKQVAALMASQESGPSHWTTYVDVDTLDDVVERIEPAGGKVLMGPMDVMTAGRMAIFSDATGAAVGLWEPHDHIGADLVNVPGALIWNELVTSDLARSKSFYTEVIGWSWSGSDEYAEIQVGGRSVGGALPRPDAIPAEVPDHWLVYFGSADVDADVERVGSLGGAVLSPPLDIPAGRFAVVADPQGAAFGLFKA